MEEYTCSVCRVKFTRSKGQVRNASTVCCSRACVSERFKESLRGSNNPNYRHGRHVECRCHCGNLKDYRSKECAICAGSGFPRDPAYGIQDADIVKAIQESSHFLEAANKIGISRQVVTRYAEDAKIDISHFESGRGRPLVADAILTNSDKRRSAHLLLRAMVEEGYIPECKSDRQCARCRQGTIWNGKPLVLQVHHINGNGTNNHIENLILLCPNCHEQARSRVRKQD